MLRMIATEKQRYDDALGRTDFAKSALVLLKANAPHERAEVGKAIGASERVQSLFQESTVAGATVSGSGLTSGAETMLSAWMDALANVSAAERIFAGATVSLQQKGRSPKRAPAAQPRRLGVTTGTPKLT